MALGKIQFHVQRTTMDCSVACLAMLLDVDYETALKAFTHNVSAHGASVRQIQWAAEQLKRPLVWTRKVDLDDATGILGVASKKWDYDHVVILTEGRIIDAQDATFWDVDDYLKENEARATSLMTVEELDEEGE